MDHLLVEWYDDGDDGAALTILPADNAGNPITGEAIEPSYLTWLGVDVSQLLV